MEKLERNIIVKNKDDIEQVLCDVIGEKCDLIYQKVLFSDDKNYVPINAKLVKMLKCVASDELNHEYSLYSEAIDEYLKYLVLIREFLEGFKIKDELLNAILINALIRIGFFSAGNNFVQNEVESKKLRIFQGIQIILGQGCCRNFSLFYQDIFQGNINHSLIYGGIIGNNLRKSMVLSAQTNHLINLVSHNGTLYGYDFNNKLVFAFVDKYKMYAIDNPSIKMIYRSYYDIFHSHHDYNQIRANLTDYGNNINGQLSLNEYIGLIKHIEQIIKNNTSYLNKFYRSTYKIKENIKEKILKVQ